MRSHDSDTTIIQIQWNSARALLKVFLSACLLYANNLFAELFTLFEVAELTFSPCVALLLLLLVPSPPRPGVGVAKSAEDGADPDSCAKCSGQKWGSLSEP